MTDEQQTNLKQLEEIIVAQVGDEALTEAFTKVCLDYQFQWKGLVYPGSQTDVQ